jgi:hypothetical protein
MNTSSGRNLWFILHTMGRDSLVALDVLSLSYCVTLLFTLAATFSFRQLNTLLKSPAFQGGQIQLIDYFP